MTEYHKPKKPTQAYLDEIETVFEYSPETGELCRYVGFEIRLVGTDTGTSLTTTVFRKQFLVHHICWYLHYKKWPDNLIDHKDTNYRNNKISNLRESNTALNQFNKIKINNLPLGVHIRKDRKQKIYQAQIYHSRKKYHLGYYDTDKEAHEAYRKEYIRVYGEDCDK